VNAVGGIMCQINENTAETMECKCKQICCKMQNDSLRCAIDGLRNNQHNSNAILETLRAIYNLLLVYSCLPGTCLLKRVQWVYYNVKGNNEGLYADEKIKVNMLISELEAFLSNS
jgi:hypothetical protein